MVIEGIIRQKCWIIPLLSGLSSIYLCHHHNHRACLIR
jgi:hypothetical protein